MYGSGGSGGASLASDLSAVKVDLVADRKGQQLHNQLLDLLTPRGLPAEPQYVLKVTLSERISEVAVASTGLGTRADVRVNAKFALNSLASGELLTNGTTRAFASYNLTDSEFSNLTAEKDAVTRATRLIALDIRSRLGAYFSRRTPS